MTKEVATAAYALLSYYANAYKNKYGKQPNINKYKEKWAASSFLEDYGKETCENVVDYYFKTTKEGHPLTWMFNNFDTLLNAYESNINDEKIRAERRAETARLKKEFLNGNA